MKNEKIRYSDISELLRKFIGAFEGLRKLGFLADQIFFEVNQAPQLGRKKSGGFREGAFCTLKAQNKEFRIILGEVKRADRLMAEYRIVATAINNGHVPQADLDRMWQESPCHQHATEFASSLMLKGFTFPKRTN